MLSRVSPVAPAHLSRGLLGTAVHPACRSAARPGPELPVRFSRVMLFLLVFAATSRRRSRANRKLPFERDLGTARQDSSWSRRYGKHNGCDGHQRFPK